MTGLRLPTLLIITDLPPVRYWIKGQLEEQFFLIVAATERKALEVAQTAHLDFIILDAAMEECDPIALCAKLRSCAPANPIPILLITGRLKKTYRDAALEAGVTDFLSDSLDSEELELRIAVGKKATAVRQKIAELSSTISKPKSELSAEYLKSKGVLQNRMIQFLNSAKKDNTHVTMLLAQIDEFPAIEATYGLSVTEEILLPLSNLLNQSARDQDVITPLRDGQFVILLTGANPAETKKIARHFQKTIYAHQFSTKQGLRKLTASFAITKIDATETALNKMILTATTSLNDLSRMKNSLFNLNEEKKK